MELVFSKKRKIKLKTQIVWWGMLLPGVLLTLIFKYGSMVGIVMAFQDFNPLKGGFFSQKWVGLENFRYVFALDGFWISFRNTLLISGIKIILGLIVPLMLALLINEVSKRWFSRLVQTTFFLPFFLSWIILGGIISEMFSYYGIINNIIEIIFGNRILFMLNNSWFRVLIIQTDVWKGMGYNMVIFLAAIIGVDQALFDAAAIDGAGRFRQIWRITLPSILPIVVLVTTLSISGLLNGGFDQVFVLYNPIVYPGGDIIDTFIYRLGIFDKQYDVATAVGLFKSAITIVLVGTSYFIAYKKFDYRIF